MANKDTWMNIVKTSSGIKRAYKACGSMLIRALGVFVRTNDKLVLFNSFGGKKFDDSPKVIYEWMQKDPRFSTYKFVWAFHNPEAFNVPGADIIKTDNLKYFITALRAGIWITNSGIERGLSFKKKKTVYLNTWHGTPIKYIGSDEYRITPEEMPKCPWDCENAQSDYEANIYSRVFNLPKENMLLFGYPRNDVLVNNDPETQKKYKEKLNISDKKIVILYAPTFREYERDSQLNCVLKPPVDFERWKKELGDNYIILMRCHYEVAKLLNDGIDGEFVRDVSDYPVLNDLMLSADILVSDYSSIIFDFSILGRPIFHYTYDYDTYKDKRGLYIDVRKELPGGSTEDELLKQLKNMDSKKAIERVEAFRENYVTAYGHATEGTVDALWELIQGRKR